MQILHAAAELRHAGKVESIVHMNSYEQLRCRNATENTIIRTIQIDNANKFCLIFLLLSFELCLFVQFSWTKANQSLFKYRALNVDSRRSDCIRLECELNILTMDIGISWKCMGKQGKISTTISSPSLLILFFRSLFWYSSEEKKNQYYNTICIFCYTHVEMCNPISERTERKRIKGS